MEHTEKPSVVRLHNFRMIANPLACATFSHPNVVWNEMNMERKRKMAGAGGGGRGGAEKWMEEQGVTE